MQQLRRLGSQRPRELSDQERLWEGTFGAEYTVRNVLDPQARAPFFRSILERAEGVSSVLEIGANRGHNLQSFRLADPSLKLTGVEINESAYGILRALEGVNAVNESIFDFETSERFDLVYTCGVLIQFNPDDLAATYKKMYDLSRRYILLSEYFNPTPVEVEYRGHRDMLFKRDFAGDLLDLHPDALRVVDYGFQWKRMNPAWDNTNWTLLERVG